MKIALVFLACGMAAPSPRPVDLKAPDGTLLKASYFAAPKPGPGVLLLHQINRDIELARLKHPTTDVQILTPSAPLRLRPLEFDSNAIARALALGRADAETCLRALDEEPRPQ